MQEKIGLIPLEPSVKLVNGEQAWYFKPDPEVYSVFPFLRQFKRARVFLTISENRVAMFWNSVEKTGHFRNIAFPVVDVPTHEAESKLIELRTGNENEDFLLGPSIIVHPAGENYPFFLLPTTVNNKGTLTIWRRTYHQEIVRQK